jgi:hypothetical protein
MPTQKHTKLYDDLIAADHTWLGKVIAAEAQALPIYSADGSVTSVYDVVSDLLREENDAQFNIVSRLSATGEWVRDATESTSLDERVSPEGNSLHDSPKIEGNNTLLRCLSRLRAIDYAIAKKLPGEDGKALRQQLKVKMGDLITHIRSLNDSDKKDEEKLKEMKALEKKFDSDLVEQLHEAGLTNGCKTAADAEKLLTYYRDLSSLVSPARTLVTLTYDEDAQMLHRETQFPVTEKTTEQKEALATARIATGSEATKTARQEADSLFADLAARDDRLLPAQTRNTHLIGVKNAFIVKNELMAVSPDELETAGTRTADLEDTLWLARSAVPVYVGKGVDDEHVQEHTRLNLDQMRLAAKKHIGQDGMTLHVTTLNTLSPLQNQAPMIRHLYSATRRRKNGDDISYMPVNIDGTHRFLDIAPALQTEAVSSGRVLPRGSAPLQKAWRLNSAATVILAAATEHRLSMVQCASGQDRTGTAIEKATQRWMEGRYAARKYNKSPAGIPASRARGGNAAEIASHLTPGSPGMKRQSIADDTLGTRKTFEAEETREFYRHSSESNKDNPVEDVSFLLRPNYEYKQKANAFSLLLQDTTSFDDDLLNTANALFRHVDNIQSQPTASPSELTKLCEVLDHSAQALSNIKKKDSKALEKNVQALEGLAKGFKSKTGWAALTIQVLKFAHNLLSCLGMGSAIEQQLNRAVSEQDTNQRGIGAIRIFKDKLKLKESKGDSSGESEGDTDPLLPRGG